MIRPPLPAKHDSPFAPDTATAIAVCFMSYWSRESWMIVRLTDAAGAATFIL